MKKLLIVAGLVAASLFGSMTAASAAGQVCYDVAINVNGNAQAAADCVALP